MSVSKTNDAVHIVGLWVFLSKEVGREKERKWKRENKRKRERRLKQINIHQMLGTFFLRNVAIYSLSRVRFFCNPMNCSMPGSTVHGISQARILE